MNQVKSGADDEQDPAPDSDSNSLAAIDAVALARLHEASLRLISNEDRSTLLQDVVDSAIAVCNADMGYMQLADEAADTRCIVAQRGFDQAFVDQLAGIRSGPSQWEAALQRGERVEVDDISNSLLRDSPWLPVLQQAGVHALQVTPMMGRDKRILGLYATHWRHPHKLPSSTLLMLDLLARHAADFIEYRQRELTLREVDRRKDEFLAVLGHELRNPLTPISLILNSIERRRRDPFKKEHETIARQVRHLIRLVDDLLDFGRIGRGTMQIRKHPMALKNAVALALQVAMPLIEKRRHRLEVRVPRIYLVGDEGRLAQVIANLVTNAARYTLPGGRISLIASRQNGEITIKVQDDGIGMPANFLTKAFQPYTQAGEFSERMTGGLGLGLAIVHHIVTLHDGTVEAYSEGPGKGSTFTVHLPEVEGRRVRGVRRPPPAKAVARGRHILLVDDNEDVLEWMPALLAKLGHSVTTATCGQEALDIVKTFTPDVAILDLGLPGMDGYEIARRLQQVFREAPVPLIALSGYGQDVDRERCREIGFVAHVTKPNLEGLLQALETCARFESEAHPVVH